MRFYDMGYAVKRDLPKCGATLFRKAGKMGRIYCAKKGAITKEDSRIDGLGGRSGSGDWPAVGYR